MVEQGVFLISSISRHTAKIHKNKWSVYCFVSWWGWQYKRVTVSIFPVLFFWVAVRPWSLLLRDLAVAPAPSPGQSAMCQILHAGSPPGCSILRPTNAGPPDCHCEPVIGFNPTPPPTRYLMVKMNTNTGAHCWIVSQTFCSKQSLNWKKCNCLEMMESILYYLGLNTVGRLNSWFTGKQSYFEAIA